MDIRFWGTRGSIASPGPGTVKYGGNTACVEVILTSGHRVVIDAGTGIRALGDHLLESGEKVDLTLLLSHTHWDHVLGMPFFKPVYQEGTRIAVDGCPRAFYGMAMIFDNHKGNGFFPVAFNDLKARIDFLDQLPRHPLHLGSAVITGMEINHPQGGMGFRLQEGRRAMVFLTDNELNPRAPLGRQPEDFAIFARDAEVLIHDAQYTPEEIEAHRGWGHSTYIDAVELALAARVRRLILFHHDPSRTDAQITRIEARARDLVRELQGHLEVEAAREGLVIHLADS